MISFIIANYNGSRFLKSAVTSALAQRNVDVEVIIVDDCSTDDSPRIAAEMAKADPRIGFMALETNGGPAAARNAALGIAGGEWIAILDNDDLIHPDRAARLIAEAESSGADMIADNLILFDDKAVLPPLAFLEGRRLDGAQWIGLVDYLEQTRMHGRAPNLGFLKPLFRREWLNRNGLRYDCDLRIAEDDDLVVRALLAGARYRLVPEPLYFYRKHGASISHRLSPANADRMVKAIARVEPAFATQPPAARRAWKRRARSIRAAAAFVHMIDAIKAGRPADLVHAALSQPQGLLLFRQPVAAKLSRLLPSVRGSQGRKSSARDVVFISRQRLVGATNGSSAYLLALAQAVRDTGLVPHLAQPSPGLFGRTPLFRLRPEMGVFETISIRASVAVGPWRIALDPAVWLRAMHGVGSRLVAKFGWAHGWLAERKAPYAVAAPWTLQDRLFVARFARRSHVPHAVLLDYFFQAEALPYFMEPVVRSAIIMHDRFSARDEQFSAAGQQDSVVAIDRPAEIAGLMKADAVIAIQKDEAEFVRREVPGTTAIVAPMAASVVAAPQPGEADKVLFVGSNTAPNVHALDWFVTAVWPIVRQARPDAVLLIAGKVCDAVVIDSAGVQLLGLVDDLAPLYTSAGVVISPLKQGSGLKIKLVEALAHGKATVVTSVTLQGVAEILSDAVRLADEPAPFGEAIVALLRDDAARAALAGKALDAAARHFGPHEVFSPFRQWLLQGAETGLPATDHART